MAILETIDLGPGTLTIGGVGDEIDASAMINNVKIAASKTKTDDRTMLSGDVKPGVTTYTYALTGNLDTDIDDGAGLFALTQAEPGSVQPFTFTPNTAAAAVATGSLVVDPLDFGASESGAPLQSDFEFALVGAPVYDFAP